MELSYLISILVVCYVVYDMFIRRLLSAKLASKKIKIDVKKLKKTKGAKKLSSFGKKIAKSTLVKKIGKSKLAKQVSKNKTVRNIASKVAKTWKSFTKEGLEESS